MSETQKGIVKYSSRDYESIMKDFWEVVPTLTELWKPEAESDPGVVLGKFLASCSDMLSINLDLLINELYAPTVSQRKNAEKIFALIGYDLGFYRAATTEVTITNTTDSSLTLDLGFNGSNFCTLNAYTDITNQDRVITYNILPMTSSYGAASSRSTRQTVAPDLDVFSGNDIVKLKPGQSCTRVAVEGELRSFTVPVADVKANNCIITLPSQHVDTTRVWLKAKSSLSSDDYLDTQWIQVPSSIDFMTPEPRFCVMYDNYSNAQIAISNYLNQLENYENNYFIVYWIDCSGVIGCVGEDVLTNLLFAKSNDVTFESGDITVSNLANTVELPNTYTVTGASPETAHEAYLNSRNYINTWDSLITLPDYNRFLNREAGVDCGLVVDCQKVLEYNLSVYNDETLTESQKKKKYITNYDFPAGNESFDWSAALSLDFDPSDPQKFVFASNFKTYTAMCFAIHNDFKNSSFGAGQVSKAEVRKETNFTRYKPPEKFITSVERDFEPLQSMAVSLDFGFTRVFNFFVVGQLYLKSPVSAEVGKQIIAEVKEALAIFFAPANRSYGQYPTVPEVLKVVTGADDNIAFFDGGSAVTSVITWDDCDVEYFNMLSFARYLEPTDLASDPIRIASDSLIK